MQSVSITTNVVVSNRAHGEAYSIRHFVIKFVIDLRQIGVFFPRTPSSSTDKTHRHDIAEILLKVSHLNPIVNLQNDAKSIPLTQIPGIHIQCVGIK
jgi:hypothetical protein